MDRRLGLVLVALSGFGFPLTQLAISRCGRRGAGLTEVVSAGLLVRDAAFVARGLPRRLRPVPAVLLHLELVAAAAAAVLGLRPLLCRTATATAAWRAVDPLEGARRAAIGALFGLHAWRMWIYLTPERGLRRAEQVAE